MKIQMKVLSKAYEKYKITHKPVREDINSLLPYGDIAVWKDKHDDLIRAVKDAIFEFKRDRS